VPRFGGLFYGIIENFCDKGPAALNRHRIETIGNNYNQQL
jgi:hypothetical protein